MSYHRRSMLHRSSSRRRAMLYGGAGMGMGLLGGMMLASAMKPPKKYCRFCGAHINSTAKFCKKCGREQAKK